MIWPHCSKLHPCPICGKTDWCSFGDRAVKCQRVESEFACESGGWYHFKWTASTKPVSFPKAKPVATLRDAGGMMNYWRQQTSYLKTSSLAEYLGVTSYSLSAIGAAWSSRFNAWAFPMYNGGLPVECIGIRLRAENGFKWAVAGSKGGCFIPSDNVPVQPIAFLPEGPTNTAALLSIGLYAIGRPNCGSGWEYIKRALQERKIYKAVIVGDNDEMKDFNGRRGRPGIEGAERTKKELNINSIIWIPPTPCNDARDFVKRGGTNELVMSLIRQKVWGKK